MQINLDIIFILCQVKEYYINEVTIYYENIYKNLTGGLDYNLSDEIISYYRAVAIRKKLKY